MPGKKPSATEARWAPLLPADEHAPTREYDVRTRIERYAGASAWHFGRLSVRQSAQVRADFGASARSWGSIRVQVRIGATDWGTSLFYDRKSQTYLFAVKAAVRKAEKVGAGDLVRARVTIA